MGTEQLKVDYLNHMGNDLTTVNAARVSFDKTSEWSYSSCPDPYGMPPQIVEEYKELSERDEKLIHYLAKHKHYSPFGHSFASFRITAPVFVARQLIKHKFLRWNEVSRRYVDDSPEFYVPDVWRGRAKDKKQGSTEEEITKLRLQGHKWQCVNEGYLKSLEVTLDLYRDMLEADVAPEMARMVLPQSMLTSWWWSGSLDAFASMCALRCKPDTQYETRMVANLIDDFMTGLFPVSWTALRAYEE